MRGYFGVGLYYPKTSCNIGSALRSCHAFGCSFLAVSGHRYRRQSSDTSFALKHIPFFEVDNLLSLRPKDCQLITVEITERSNQIANFVHPERAYYIFGPEDGGVPNSIIDQSQYVIKIPSNFCLNLACAVSIVCYDRVIKNEKRSNN